jgi:hypothetical protein
VGVRKIDAKCFTLTTEGSANLRGNGSGREQFALIKEPGLLDWDAAWIEQLVT